MPARGNRGGSRERGQAVLELSIILTVLTLLVLGAIDMGRLFGTEEQLANAAHEGAKVAAEYYSEYSGNPTGLAALVKNQIVQEGQLDPTKVTNVQITTQTPSSPDYPSQQIIQVSFQYQFTFDGPWKILPGISNPMTLPPVVSSEVTR